ncbi:hypothetical protein [Paraburkholderia sp. DHOC27]|uniref:hypothetical protein n=1 Tax=Paraburkholderia sp. DHOC27 TaxID=2303330 RepID=UPI000E3E76A5|nr:hypothetical protein [Paraburkholderia sp. DHOC27]RFU46463.1 hypothetical protein D0B32_15655 [Paraburkholderia sp. DHOC27]
MRITLAILCLAALAGCATASDVTSTQSGHLAVTARGNLNSEFVSWTSVRNTALDQAKAYCAAQGKQARPVDTSTDGMMRITSDHVTVVFDCE